MARFDFCESFYIHTFTRLYAASSVRGCRCTLRRPGAAWDVHTRLPSQAPQWLCRWTGGSALGRGSHDGLAAQSELALTAHRLGCVPTSAAPTPLDCDSSFAYEAGTLRWGHFIESWLIVLGHARVRTRNTGASRGTAQPLDAGLPAWSPPPTAADGGGPSIWMLVCDNGRRVTYSSRLARARASLGIVRLIDAYGGRDELGEPRWWTWGEVRSYYVVQCAEPLPSWLRQVQLEYSRLLRELDGQREASQ